VALRSIHYNGSCLFPNPTFHSTGTIHSESWIAGAYEWCCRFSSGHQGNWSVILTAKDSHASSTTSGPYLFNVVKASVPRAGLVKVSNRDSRYFERYLSTGTTKTFFGVGENIAFAGNSFTRQLYSRAVMNVGGDLTRVFFSNEGDSFDPERIALGQYNDTQLRAAQLDLTVEDWAAQNGTIQYCLLIAQSWITDWQCCLESQRL
jgi:hypothetical protein